MLALVHKLTTTNRMCPIINPYFALKYSHNSSSLFSVDSYPLSSKDLIWARHEALFLHFHLDRGHNCPRNCRAHSRILGHFLRRRYHLVLALRMPARVSESEGSGKSAVQSRRLLPPTRFEGQFAFKLYLRSN